MVKLKNKIMNSSIKITHNGSRYTKTYFKGFNKNTVIVTVWIDSGVYGHNPILSYNHSIEIKGYRKKNKEFIYCSENCLDERFKQYITEQQLYEAYHNHWNKINPIRLFHTMCKNSEIIIKDEIKQLNVDVKHKAY